MSINEIPATLDIHPGLDTFASAQTASVPSMSETTVWTYTVPAGKVLTIRGIVGTGTATFRFKIKVDASTVLVARTSAAEPTTNPHLGDSGTDATAGQVVIVTGYQEEIASQTAEVTLFGFITS